MCVNIFVFYTRAKPSLKKKSYLDPFFKLKMLKFAVDILTVSVMMP